MSDMFHLCEVPVERCLLLVRVRVMGYGV
jgi:hypothetical protein